MKETHIENARITKTMLGVEDHGIFTWNIFVELENGRCMYGGYTLDKFDKETGERTLTAKGAQSIAELMRTIGVESWEKVKGRFIRCENEGIGGRITRIGHLMEDKWFSFEEFFKEGESN